MHAQQGVPWGVLRLLRHSERPPEALSEELRLNNPLGQCRWAVDSLATAGQGSHSTACRKSELAYHPCILPQPASQASATGHAEAGTCIAGVQLQGVAGPTDTGEVIAEVTLVPTALPWRWSI